MKNKRKKKESRNIKSITYHNGDIDIRKGKISLVQHRSKRGMAAVTITGHRGDSIDIT